MGALLYLTILTEYFGYSFFFLFKKVANKVKLLNQKQEVFFFPKSCLANNLIVEF